MGNRTVVNEQLHSFPSLSCLLYQFKCLFCSHRQNNSILNILWDSLPILCFLVANEQHSWGFFWWRMLYSCNLWHSWGSASQYAIDFLNILWLLPGNVSFSSQSDEGIPVSSPSVMSEMFLFPLPCSKWWGNSSSLWSLEHKFFALFFSLTLLISFLYLISWRTTKASEMPFTHRPPAQGLMLQHHSSHWLCFSSSITSADLEKHCSMSLT